MKKDKKFLTNLESNLMDISKNNRDMIIAKYEKIINEEKAKNRRIGDILKELGNPTEIAKNEKLLVKESFFVKIKNDINRKYKSINKTRRTKKFEKEKKKKNVDKIKSKTKTKTIIKKRTDKNNSSKEKNGIKNKLKSFLHFITKDIDKKDKVKKEKIKKEKVVKEKKENYNKLLDILKRKPKKEKIGKEEKPKKEKVIKEKKEKNSKLLDIFKRKTKKDKEKNDKILGLFKRKPKKEKDKNKKFHLFGRKKKKDSLNDIIEDIHDDIKEEVNNVSDEIKDFKENIQDEFADVNEIVTEKHLFESKAKRRRRIIRNILGVILITLLLFIWLWITVVFIASLFAYLDGVKFIGLNIALFGLALLVLWIVIIINRTIFNKRHYFRLNIIVIVISLVLIALGIVLMFRQVSTIESVKDVTIKYSMTNKLTSHDFSSNPDKQFNITFNSNYNTQYTVEYDETLKDKFKLEVKYYECYYDYYIKESSNNVYVSLKLDNRDRLSVYIDDLKEGMIFDNDELSRYSVKIIVNPDDAGRLVINN